MFDMHTFTKDVRSYLPQNEDMFSLFEKDYGYHYFCDEFLNFIAHSINDDLFDGDINLKDIPIYWGEDEWFYENKMGARAFVIHTIVVISENEERYLKTKGMVFRDGKYWRNAQEFLNTVAHELLHIYCAQKGLNYRDGDDDFEELAEVLEIASNFRQVYKYFKGDELPSIKNSEFFWIFDYPTIR